MRKRSKIAAIHVKHKMGQKQCSKCKKKKGGAEESQMTPHRTFCWNLN